MEYEKLVQALRSRAPLVDNALLDQAADAIENLQRAVQAHSELGNRMSNLNFGLVDLVLQADAAVSAAEEKLKLQAARFKEAVTTRNPCDICVGVHPPESDRCSKGCGSDDWKCSICADPTCRCKDCREMDKWELMPDGALL